MPKIERLFATVPDDGDENIMVRQPIDSAAWIWHPGAVAGEKVFLLFRKAFESDGSPLTIHVSADERYELLLDGVRVSRGPHRGDLNHWNYSSYRIELEPGRHEFKALAWALKTGLEEWSLHWASPVAQLSWRGGFVFKAEGPSYDAALTTGVAAWSVARAGGWKPLPVATPGVFGVGAPFEWTGGPEASEPETSAVVVRKAIRDCLYGEPEVGWRLEPSPLPDMLAKPVFTGTPVASGTGRPSKEYRFKPEDLANARRSAWARLFEGQGPISVPAGSEEYVLVDLGDYYTGYPLLEVSGGRGSTLTWAWAEALFDEPHTPGKEMAKSSRDIVEGKIFIGFEDVFHADGRELSMSVPWWRSGRYCLLCAKTSAEPLVVRKAAVEETGYPLSMDATFSADAPDLDPILKICVRAMRACSHETFMDCPYYEQLMYVGDTRLEMLTTHAMSSDARLVKRAIELFDFSRVNFGFVNERYPAARIQHSPTFSMIWTLMLHDFVMWRGAEPEWLLRRLVGMRSMLEHFAPFTNKDGLLESLPGWSFMDWVADWRPEPGVPPDGRFGVSSSINLLYALALKSAAALEELAGEPLLARRHAERAAAVNAKVMKLFWCAKRGLIADDLNRTRFSEHSQALAILSGAVEGAAASALLEKTLSTQGLAKASSYFVFYLFEAFVKLGRGELIIDRLETWREMLRLGFKTTPEEPRTGTRSDCHAWSAQILFELLAGVAGIRPASPGFESVRIAPRLGSLKELKASLPHPKGSIELEIAKGEAKVSLPPSLSGVFVWNGVETKLKGGVNRVACA